LAWVLVRYVLSWIILAALIFPTAAFATKSPCTADRLNFCKGVKASVEDIRTCLQGHKDELSEPCKARLRDQLPTDASSTPPEQPPPAAAEDSSAETNHATVPSSPPAAEGGNSRPAAESIKATEGPSATAHKAKDSAQASPEQNGGKSQAAESKKPLQRLTSPTHKPERLTQHVTRAAPNPPLARRSATVRKYRTAKQVVRELPPRRIAQHSPGPMQGSTLSAYDKKVWTTLAGHRQKRISGGSAQVTFGVGPSGELVYARLSRSSGNSNVDQMAIATVRKSAPFPQPTAAHGSVQSFTIRIGSR
jgi:TonB family protein